MGRYSRIIKASQKAQPHSADLSSADMLTIIREYPDLGKIVARWPKLPPKVRTAVLTLADLAKPNVKSAGSPS